MINPSRIFGAIGLTGGGDKTLDSFPSNMMQQDHAAIVIDGSNVYFYICDVDSGLEENVPFVIKPDDIEVSVTPSNNAKRWIMVSPKYFGDDIIQSLGKYIQTSQIKAIDGQPINLVSSDGTIISIGTNGTLSLNNTVITGQLTVNNDGRKPPFVIDSTLKVDKLNADMVDGFHATSFVKIDGSSPFTAPQQGIDPVNDNELTTKSWVETYVLQIKDQIYSYIDDAIANIDIIADLEALQQQVNNHLSPSSDDHTQYAHLDGRRNFFGPIGGVEPTLPDHFTTKNYVDNITVNHTNLTNLDSDDHLQYIHIDARRGFENPVLGKTPIVDFHLATKEYVDERIDGIFNTKDLQIHTFDHHPTEWVINHNFGKKYVVVDFYNKFDNKQIKPDKLHMATDDTCIAYFSEPTDGYAVVTGIVEEFPMSLNMTWIVEHTFESKNVIFNIFDENDDEIFPLSTTIVDDTHIAFTFVEQKQGTAVLSNDIVVYDYTTPSLEWNVFHSFNNKNLLANCFNLSNQEIVPKDIEATDVNTLLITFEEPEAGYVIVSGSEAIILDPGLYIIDHSSLTNLGVDDHLQYPLVDGSRGFTGVVPGIDPILDEHLATKGYVDTEIENSLNVNIILDHDELNGLLNDDHTQYILVDGSRGFDGPVEGVTPTSAFHLTTKQYVDSVVNSSSSVAQKGISDLVQGADNITVALNPPLTQYAVIVTIENITDVDPSQYSWTLIRKTTTEFDILFSGYIDSPNYKINWAAYPLN